MKFWQRLGIARGSGPQIPLEIQGTYAAVKYFASVKIPKEQSQAAARRDTRDYSRVLRSSAATERVTRA